MKHKISLASILVCIAIIISGCGASHLGGLTTLRAKNELPTVHRHQVHLISALNTAYTSPVQNPEDENRKIEKRGVVNSQCTSKQQPPTSLSKRGISIKPVIRKYILARAGTKSPSKNKKPSWYHRNMLSIALVLLLVGLLLLFTFSPFALLFLIVAESIAAKARHILVRENASRNKVALAKMVYTISAVILVAMPFLLLIYSIALFREVLNLTFGPGTNMNFYFMLHIL